LISRAAQRNAAAHGRTLYAWATVRAMRVVSLGQSQLVEHQRIRLLAEAPVHHQHNDLQVVQ
jgi:hypothetical protein